MRPFLFEGIFWTSALNALLRFTGASRRSVYRVSVCAEPVWFTDAESRERTAGGLFATKFVIADSEAQARDGSHARARRTRRFAGNPQGAPVLFEVEEADVVRGVVWCQMRGFSLWTEDHVPEASS